MFPRISTARWTGIFYLGLAISGMAGFLLIRSELYVPDDALATLTNLQDRAVLARAGVATDLTVVLTQSLAALWFFRLFRREHRFAAGSIAAFGLINAVAILVGTAFTATALVVAGDATLAPGGDQAATVQLLYGLNTAAWDVGALFFGLWLIPMGFVVVTSRVMPVVLGWVLMAGGIGYVISAYVTQLAPDAPAIASGLLTGLATVGEFWMIGYLLTIGVRTFERSSAPQAPVW